MPSRKPSRATRSGPGAPAPADPAVRERREALIVKLQIAAAVFAPMLLLGVWLQSQGFFGVSGP